MIIQHPDECYSTQVTDDRHHTSIAMLAAYPRSRNYHLPWIGRIGIIYLINYPWGVWDGKIRAHNAKAKTG